MKHRYEIAALNKGGNVIDVTVTAAEDGSLTIYDLSYGPAADACFGEGRDVEVWLEIAPAAVKQFARHLFGEETENPAARVARHLASTYQNEGSALRKIQKLLDEQNIPYEEDMW